MLYLLLLLQIAIADETKSGLEAYDDYLSEQRQLCAEMQVGGPSRTIDMDSPMKSTGGMRMTNDHFQYVLSRTGDKSYKVLIPIHYNADPGRIATGIAFSNTSGPPATEPEFRKYVNHCLAEYNPLLKDSNSNSIELAIDDTREQADKHGVKPVEIRLADQLHGGSAQFYTTDMNCIGLIHEMLHLTGLKDEYHVSSKAKPDYLKDAQRRPISSDPITTTTFDCRASTPANTVMASHMEFAHDMDRNFDNDFEQGSTCICEKGKSCAYPSTVLTNPQSGNVIYPIDGDPFQESCAAGFKSFDYRKMTPTDYARLRTYLDVSKTYSIVKRRRPISPNRLLAPAHIRHITHPGCNEINKNFYSCSRRAYDTSTKEGCGPLPQTCQDGSWFK